MVGGAIFKKENNLDLGAASGSLREKNKEKCWIMVYGHGRDLRTPDARVLLCFFIVF